MPKLGHKLAPTPRQDLEAQLASLTQEFVARLVEAIRNASFAEVAALSSPRVIGGGVGAIRERPPRAAAPAAPAAKRSAGAPPVDLGRERQTAQRRAELGERVVRTLEHAARPLGVRALSSELGVAPDLLTAPLRELRAAGKVRKHGEKRSTTYSVA
jgi:hypothetical protein